MEVTTTVRGWVVGVEPAVVGLTTGNPEYNPMFPGLISEDVRGASATRETCKTCSARGDIMNKIFRLVVAPSAAVSLISCGGSETSVSRLQSVRPLQITSGTPPEHLRRALTLQRMERAARRSRWRQRVGRRLTPGVGPRLRDLPCHLVSVSSNLISGAPTALGSFNVVVT
jgi:hypothetical protein